MITLYLGNLGSGKTANAVRSMITDNSGLTNYTNIEIVDKYEPDFPHIIQKDPKSIIKKTIEIEGKKEIVKYSFNSEEWLKLPKPMNVIWDEITFIADNRKSAKSINDVTTEFTYMCRRVVGMDKYGYGEYIFLAQRLTMDIRIRELVTTVIYHTLHWLFTCENCGLSHFWTSEKYNLKNCMQCEKRTLTRSNYISERFHFSSVELYTAWKFMYQKTYFKRDMINDIADYFKYYETLAYIKY